MRILILSLLFANCALAVSPILMAVRVSKAVEAVLSTKKEQRDISKYNKYDALSVNTEFLRLNEPLKYVTIEEKLQQKYKKELEAFTKWRLLTSPPGEKEFKSLVGKAVLLNASELAAANLMFSLSNRCKLDGIDECQRLGSSLASRILSRAKEIETLSTDKKMSTPALWNKHLNALFTALLIHKDKLSELDANILTSLKKSHNVADY